MIKDLIVLVQSILNGELAAKKGIEEIVNFNCTDTHKNSAIRLCKSWALYTTNSIYANDFELALKDFLALHGGAIKLTDYTLSRFGMSLGLRTNETEIWSIETLPPYIEKKFVQKVFTAQKVEKVKEQGYFLATNAFIAELTGFTKFKSEEQKLCVMGALRAPRGSSVLVSMSTGGGKSLITQTLAFQQDGLTIVVVPTISLMVDQAKNAQAILKEHVQEIAIYNSSIDFSRIKNKLLDKTIKLLFLSPEALIKNKELSNIINELNAEGWLQNLIIDEAHIIFEWGDAFRLDFQCIDVLRRNLLKTNPKLRTYLLSATFNQKNVALLKQFYSTGDNWIELRCDALRREIHYNFIQTSRFEKEAKIIELVSLLPHPMIIYVDRPEEAKRVQKLLQDYDINNTGIFTGETTASDREKLLGKWKGNNFQIMIATCAFGVGVDKKDVRTVLHLYVPDNINKYYQEAGRGGRDGCASLSIVLYTPEDILAAFNYIRSKVLTAEKMIGRWFSMLNGKTSHKYGDGTVSLDTSIKPSYADQDDYITHSTTRDMDWNIYLLLFLKRHHLIDVESADYCCGNYHMLVRVLDQNLFINSEKTHQLIDEHREKEWADAEKSYKSMKTFLSKCRDQCVSEILLTEYPLISSEHCSGCNNHVEPRTVNDDNLPLINKIGAMNKKADINVFADPIVIIRSDDFDDLEKRLITKGVDTIIVNRECEIDPMAKQNKELMYFTIEEFKKILAGKEYFLSSTIVIECPEKEDQIIRVLQLVQKVKEKFNTATILLTKDNHYISAFNKRIYEIVEASYLEDYMFQ